MFDELTYIIWYHRLLGKTQKGKKALEYYGGYKELYEAVRCGREATGLLKNTKPEKFEAFSLIDAEKVRVDCEVNEWHMIPCTSPDYPKALLEIKDCPHILFCDGDKNILSRNVMFSVVGSRVASGENELTVYNMAYNLARTGAVIVSGAALGIDSAAHLGAINAGGSTVGVLGCGLGNSYVDRIGDFYDEIKSSGVYISEMFPYEKVTMSSFPDRNRIISGLCNALLVACASEDSGSLNTAKHAKKQKRRIFVPHESIISSKGCDLLKNDGADIFYNAGSMAYPFREFYEEGLFNEEYCEKSVLPAENSVKRDDIYLPGKRTVKGRNPSQKMSKREEKNNISVPQTQETSDLPLLSEQARKIYDILADGIVDTETLTELTNTDIISVQIALSELEAEGLVKCYPGGKAERL